MLRLATISFAAGFLFFANAAFANSCESKILNILPEIRTAIVQKEVVNTLRSYNRSRSDMTQADIDMMEATWQSELSSANQPLIRGVVRNIVALRMRKVIRDTGRVISEIRIIDAKGISIAQTSVGPNIWRPETEKIIRASMIDGDTVFIDKFKIGDSTWAEINFTVADPDTNKPIGTVVITIDVAAL